MEQEAMPVKRRRISPPPSEQGIFDQLPDSMVEEILLRLPLSSVFASRCISKRCLSLTASPYFIQRFCSGKAPFNDDPPLGLLLQGSYDCTTREFSVCSGVPDVKFSGFSLTFLPGFRLNGNDPITVMGSCEDLLLCCNRERFQSDYFVVNPITQQWIALPPTLRLHKYVLTGFVCDPHSVPEARKGGKLRYRIVRIPVSKHSQTELNVEIFSSENGQWNEFTVTTEGLWTFLWSSRAVACNGILYWQLRKSGVKLMRFDPFNSKKKEIDIIQDPLYNFNEELKKYKLAICQGKLRMCQVSWFGKRYSEPSHVEIWELEEGHDGAEWQLAKEVWLQDMVVSRHSSYVQLRKAARGCGYNSMWPLALHPSKGDAIYFGCNRMNKIICYDFKRMSLEIVGEYHLEERFGGWVDAFPFQQPRWPTPLPALPKL